MKKILLLLSSLLATVVLSAQTMTFGVSEVIVKEGFEDDLIEAHDVALESVKLLNGAQIIIERLRKQKNNEATHRVIWFTPLGLEWFEGGNEDKGQAFWAKYSNMVETTNEYSGRILSWQEGNTEENNYVHIWDYIPENPKQFKIGHDKIVKKFKNDFQGRVVGFGTYDLQRPDNATHWVALTGKNREDHLMLYDKLQSNSEFTKLIAERGNSVAVKDYIAEILKVYK